MNSAICVHFVKECLIRFAMILFTYICIFVFCILYLYFVFCICILYSCEQSSGRKSVNTLMLFLVAREKAVHLKLSSQAHQSRKVEVT